MTQAEKLREVYLQTRAAYALNVMPTPYRATVDDLTRLRHYLGGECGQKGPATSLLGRVTCEACYALLPGEQQEQARTRGHMRYVLGLEPLPSAKPGRIRRRGRGA